MSPLLKLVASILRSYPGIFTNAAVDAIYLVVLGLVAGQYFKIQRVEERLYGKAINRGFQQTLTAVWLGLLGGLFASLLLVLMGVSVTDSGITYLMPIAVLLYLISPRFLCYSYAGGLAGLSYLIFGWPKVNVPAVMALVACLHAVEAFLIRLSGHTCVTPVYVSHDKRGVVGGFTLQRFWPIPIIVLFLVKMPNLSLVSDLIHLPDWWPLIAAPDIPGPGEPVFAMMPVVAALGYGDIAIATNPKDKAKITSNNLMVFSLLLLGLSIAASRLPLFAWVATLFSPIAHEIVIRVGLNEEFGKKPLYTPVQKGVLLLDVVADSPAKNAGLKTGDLVCLVNDMEVNDKKGLGNAISAAPGPLSFWIIKSGSSGSLVKVDMDRKGNEGLGLIPVPESGDSPVAGTLADGILLKILKNTYRKIKMEK